MFKIRIIRRGKQLLENKKKVKCKSIILQENYSFNRRCCSEFFEVYRCIWFLQIDKKV